jgi:cation transport ATPase
MEMATESTAQDDQLIQQSEKAEAEADSDRTARAANLFDLRRIIGGLFAVYGVLLFVLGLAASQKEIDKAAGWNLNLWVGLAMIIVAAIFLGWAFKRPLSEQLDEYDDDEPTGSRAASETASSGAGSDGKRFTKSEPAGREQRQH